MTATEKMALLGTLIEEIAAILEPKGYTVSEGIIGGVDIYTQEKKYSMVQLNPNQDFVISTVSSSWTPDQAGVFMTELQEATDLVNQLNDLVAKHTI